VKTVFVSGSTDGIGKQTALDNILFTYKLAGDLKKTDTTVNCLHPGVIGTVEHKPRVRQGLSFELKSPSEPI
jgi:NAD(P)-dependent dehydrogenase (short-subunit alcohol dehydrogenase family)